MSTDVQPVHESLARGQSARGENPSLTIVIPALNEEEAIADTVSRCLAVKNQLEASVGSVEVIVVNDGSTDRTGEIAAQFDDVRVIAFQHNRGYGAAIKEGWKVGDGTLLAFLDADGTCDPKYLVEMCRTALDESADIVLGSRMGPQSKMPRIRRLGNRLFALLLGLLCGRQVTDTASGMRVVRRTALKYLYPLPDGLHFTPAMSARALLNSLRVVEIPMQYEERIGDSKLSVVQDGMRFLRAILSGVLCYRPERVFLLMMFVCLLALLMLAAYPVEFYFTHGRLEEWMIYRFVACYVLGAFVLLLALTVALIHRIAALGPRRKATGDFVPYIIGGVFNRRVLIAGIIMLMTVSGYSLWPGLVEYSRTGHVTLHWSRLLAGAFALFSALQTSVFVILLEVASTWNREHEQSNSRHNGL